MFGEENTNTKTKREDLFVDVAVVKTRNVEDDWKQSERAYHLKLQDKPKEILVMEDIVNFNDRLVSLRGVAGIGKTFLLETISYRWANGILYTGENNSLKVDLLFTLTCRELNLLPQNCSWIDVLFDNTYVSECMKQDISDISRRIMIVIDGLDEWTRLDELRKSNFENISPVASAVYELINPTSSVLSDHIILLSGRPQACDFVESMISSNTLKRVESIGFSESNVTLYVKHYLRKDENLVALVLEKIEEETTLKNMSTIPVYLWIICAMYRYDNTVTTPTTSTRFLLYALLIFIREHMKKTSNTLQELVNDEKILEILRNVASLSYEMYTDGKVVFYENELREKGFLNLDLEMTGFIVKRQSERYGQIFYFRHMVLQEIFTAIHIFLHPDSHTPDQLINHYSSCMTIISGLEGILEHSKLSTQLQNDVAKIFVSNISKYLPDKRPMNVIPYFLKLLIGNSNIVASDDIIDYHTWTLFWACLFESGTCLPEASKDKFNDLYFEVDLFHHELLYLLNFLDQLEYEYIDYFSITMKNKLFTRQEFERLSRHLSHSENVCIVGCKISTNALSNFSSNVSKSDSYLKCLQFDDCNLSDNDIIQLLPCITHIKKLRISINYDITGVAMSAISNVIKSTIEANKESKLEEIDVSFCGLTDNDVIQLLQCITHIKKLCLEDNDITGVAMSAISNVIISTIEANQESKLEKIDVTNCELTDNDVIQLLPCITHIKKLRLEDNDITGVAMSAISNVIKSTIEANKESKLEEIDVSFCKLTDNDVIQLLPCITHIKKLRLSFNRCITGVAMRAISSVIKSTIDANKESKLEEIDISNCELTDNDVIQLLPGITHIKKLNLRFNDDLTGVAMSAISNVIKSTIEANQELKLEEIDVNGCKLTDNDVI